MRRTKKSGRQDGLQAAGGPFDAGVVPPRGRHATFGASRRGPGRLGKAVRSAGKKNVPMPKRTKQPAEVSPPEKSVKKSAKKASRRTQSPKASASGPPLMKSDSRPDPARQRRAKTASKQSRIKKSGLDSRVMGHVSARGKRNQARRDTRNG